MEQNMAMASGDGKRERELEALIESAGRRRCLAPEAIRDHDRTQHETKANE